MALGDMRHIFLHLKHLILMITAQLWISYHSDSLIFRVYEFI